MMENATKIKNRKSGAKARAATIRTKKLQRNQEIVKRFNELYNVKRLRYDDVLLKLENEFYIGQARITAILRNPTA